MRARSSSIAATLGALRGSSSSTSLFRFAYSRTVRTAAGMANKQATSHNHQPFRTVQAT